MRQVTIQELAQKSTADANMIALYKKQIAQLAACIADREARILRRDPVIQKISLRQQTEFNHKIYRAADDARDAPLQVGQRYRVGPDFLTVSQKGDIFTVQFDNEPGPRISGKDLETMSKVFFFDFPAATLQV